MFKGSCFSAEEMCWWFHLEAMDYGFPPHGGFGYHGFVMLLAGEGNIREVIAFLRTITSPTDTSSPISLESLKQLEELNK